VLNTVFPQEAVIEQTALHKGHLIFLYQIEIVPEGNFALDQVFINLTLVIKASLFFYRRKKKLHKCKAKAIWLFLYLQEASTDLSNMYFVALQTNFTPQKFVQFRNEV